MPITPLVREFELLEAELALALCDPTFSPGRRAELEHRLDLIRAKMPLMPKATPPRPAKPPEQEE